MEFHKILMKMENASSLAPRHAEAPQTVVITNKFIGPGGVRSDRKSQTSSKTTFPALFNHLPSEINEIKEFLTTLVNWVKRKSLGGPAPRSLFFVRILKVPEPPECTKSMNFMKFHEIGFMKSYGIS